MLQQDGNYVKYIKDEFLPLAKARAWDIGPIPVGSATKVPQGPVQSRKDAAAQQITINLTPAGDAAKPAVAAPPIADPQVPAPPVAAPKAAAMPPPPPPAKAQDRTLELAGLQALMEGQKQREQAAVAEEISKVQAQLVLASQNAAQPKTGQSHEISWSTHKKEGMRLKRLMEESADGPKNYPHMAKMWSGTKEDRGIKGIQGRVVVFRFQHISTNVAWGGISHIYIYVYTCMYVRMYMQIKCR